MASVNAQIQSLLSPPSTSKSYAAVLAYLDETFPTVASLTEDGTLDRHWDEAQRSSSKLADELQASTSSMSQKISTARSSTISLLKSAKELSLTRHSLADQVAALAEELLPTGKGKQRTLLEELEGLHIRLDELQEARSYVSVIERALKLSEDAVAQVQASEAPTSESSLAGYKALQLFIHSVATATQTFSSTAMEPPALIAFLHGLRERTWNEITNALSERLLKAAEGLHWPTPIQPAAYALQAPEERLAFESHFLDLLRLQSVGEQINQPMSGSTIPDDKLRSALRKQGLYPLVGLMEPLNLRFRYHFDGKRQTNRADKPEWYFTHVMNLMHDHRVFMTTIVQRLLEKGGYAEINAMDEFSRILFSMPYRKLKRTIPQILNSPALLAHTVYQTLIFDGSVRDGGFDIRRTWEGRERARIAKADRRKSVEVGGKHRRSKSTQFQMTNAEWEGLSDVILGKKEWFDAWLVGEQRFADQQYNEIISSADAWQISDDTGDETSGGTGPPSGGSPTTTAARRFKALIERVTERYQPLPHLVYKSHFLFDIQLPLLESYLSRITSSLDAYERLSSSFVRAVPGALAGQVGHGSDTKRLTSGVEGLTRIIKALVSAQWIKAGMESWAEDLFFLEMWQGIRENPLLRIRAEANKGLPNPSPTGSKTDSGDTLLFDVLVSQYTEIVERAEDMAVKQVCFEVETELKPYFSSQYDHTNAAVAETDNVSLPATLLSPVTLLSSELSFLARSLPPPAVTALYRKIASTISNHIVQRAVLYRGKNQISPKDGKAFKAEAATWVETSRTALSLSVSRAEVPWHYLLDASAVVGIPEEHMPEVISAIFNGSDDTCTAAIRDLGVRGLGREEVQAFLRTRTDCRR